MKGLYWNQDKNRKLVEERGVSFELIARYIEDKNEEIERYSTYAKAALTKDKRINIRISGKDLESIQDMAVEEGIPYQTLISSLIHKFVTGRMVDRKQVQ